jgi:phage tail-like protein
MARTYANDPLQMFRFRVSMPGLPAGMGFQKVSGLSREIGVVEYDEGGYSHTHKLTGKEQGGEVTLEKGMFANTDLEEIYKRSLNNPDYRTTVIIEHLDKFGKVARSWTLAEAWVSKWEGSELDATSEDVAIESITIQFEYYL